MDALLSVYDDGRTEHGDGLAALAPASGVALVAGGAPGGGRWPGELRPRSRREARGAAGGRRWLGSALRGRAGGRADWRSSSGRGGRRSIGAGSGSRATAPG